MQAEPVHSNDHSDQDIFVAPKQQAGKKKRDAIGLSRQKKFMWRKHPDATAFLCAIKPQLLDPHLRQHEKIELKETTAEDLLKWWKGYEKDGRNQGDMCEIIHQFYKNRLQFKDWHKYEQAEMPNATLDPSRARNESVSEPSTTPAITLDPESDDLRALLAPLLKHIQARARGASVLWAEAHQARVKERKILLGGGRGTHQRAIGQLFNELDAEEQAEWQERADAEKAALLGDPDLCFKNQEGFASLIAQLLSSFIGFGPKQIGLALFEVVMAIRCKDGSIQRDRITVGITAEQETFGEYDGGPSQRDINRWNGFVDEYLPHNPVERDRRLQYQPDGRPRLPPFERTWSLDEVASILDVWFVSLWHYHREREQVTLPHGLDWDVIAKSPAEYIPTTWLNKDVQRPAEIEFFLLPTVYQQFFKAQDSTDPFRWMHTPLTRARTPLAITVPATPVKMTRILYSSPSKRTPSARLESDDTTDTRAPTVNSSTVNDGQGSMPMYSTPANARPPGVDEQGAPLAHPPRIDGQRPLVPGGQDSTLAHLNTASVTPHHVGRQDSALVASTSPCASPHCADGQDSVLVTSTPRCMTPDHVTGQDATLLASTSACATPPRDTAPVVSTPPCKSLPRVAGNDIALVASTPGCAIPPRSDRHEPFVVALTSSTCATPPHAGGQDSTLASSGQDPFLAASILVTCATPRRADGQDALLTSSALLPLDRQDPNLARSTLACAIPPCDATLVVPVSTCATPRHLAGQNPALIDSTLSYATPPRADGQDPFVVTSTPLTRATPPRAGSALHCVDRQDAPAIDSAPVCPMPTLASGLGHTIACLTPACATPPRDATVVVPTPTSATLPHLAGQDHALVVSTPPCVSLPGVDEQDPASIHSVPVCSTLSHADGLDPALTRSTPACGLNHTTGIPTDAPVSGENQATELTDAPLLYLPSPPTAGDPSPEGSTLLLGQKRSATAALGMDAVSQREPKKKRCRKPPPVAPSTRVLRGRNATASTSDAMAKKAPENRG